MLFYCFAEKVFEPFTLQYAKLLNFSKYPAFFPYFTLNLMWIRFFYQNLLILPRISHAPFSVDSGFRGFMVKSTQALY